MKKTFLCLMLLFSVSLALSAVGIDPPKVVIKPALLVIDIQNAYLPLMSEQDRKFSLEMINYAIGLFRESGFPVIRIYHTDLKAGPEPGSEGFEFPKTAAVRSDDLMIIKNYPNAFMKTGLDKMLRDKGINTLFICGLSATGCALATFFGAWDHEYEVFMIKDALLSHDAALTKAVQEICDTVNLSALKLLLENVGK